MPLNNISKTSPADPSEPKSSESTLTVTTSTTVNEGFESRGVSVAFLKWFIAQHESTPGFKDMTTTDVCNIIIKPETEARKCAYLELIVDKSDDSSLPFVGPAQCFVSHAWKYKFIDLVQV